MRVTMIALMVSCIVVLCIGTTAAAPPSGTQSCNLGDAVVLDLRACDDSHVPFSVTVESELTEVNRCCCVREHRPLLGVSRESGLRNLGQSARVEVWVRPARPPVRELAQTGIQDGSVTRRLLPLQQDLVVAVTGQSPVRSWVMRIRRFGLA